MRYAGPSRPIPMIDARLSHCPGRCCSGRSASGRTSRIFHSPGAMLLTEAVRHADRSPECISGGRLSCDHGPIFLRRFLRRGGRFILISRRACASIQMLCNYPCPGTGAPAVFLQHSLHQAVTPVTEDRIIRFRSSDDGSEMEEETRCRLLVRGEEKTCQGRREMDRCGRSGRALLC